MIIDAAIERLFQHPTKVKPVSRKVQMKEHVDTLHAFDKFYDLKSLGPIAWKKGSFKINGLPKESMGGGNGPTIHVSPHYLHSAPIIFPNSL